MVTVKDILEFVQTLAPTDLKMEWDNVGLLCGNRDNPVTKVLVALDPFEHICREAADIGAELIVTHHPLIFQPTRSVTDDTSIGRSIRLLCRHDISAINAHTNLDCAPGGVNDTLAKVLGLSDVQVLLDTENLLRCGSVAAQDLEAFLTHIKESLGCEALRYVSGGRKVSRVAVGGGSCGDLLRAALDAGCDTFITADVKYNQFWDAYELGLNLIDAGHFYTENPICSVLVSKIQAAFPEIDVKLSVSHFDPMKFF